MSTLSHSQRIITVGFDGPNRVGKGTQCELLQAWLTQRDIPSLIVRGDGSRTGLGTSRGDPVSVWWQTVNLWLRTSAATTDDWNHTSYRLARELIVWRDRVLPCIVRQQGKQLGVLIVDRSLPSRTMVLRAAGVSNIADRLYTLNQPSRGRQIDPRLVCPDVIFVFTAPYEVLINRLDQADLKYAFRKQLINDTHSWFADVEHYLPAPLQDRVVHMDGTQDAARIFTEVCATLKTRLAWDV